MKVLYKGEQAGELTRYGMVIHPGVNDVPAVAAAALCLGAPHEYEPADAEARTAVEAERQRRTDEAAAKKRAADSAARKLAADKAAEEAAVVEARKPGRKAAKES